jgi:hypothetical protein
LFVHPFESSAIHDAAIGVTKELEHPECVAGPPVVFVAVENDVGILGCTEAGHEFFETRFVEIVSDERIV